MLRIVHGKSQQGETPMKYHPVRSFSTKHWTQQPEYAEDWFRELDQNIMDLEWASRPYDGGYEYVTEQQHTQTRDEYKLLVRAYLRSARVLHFIEPEEFSATMQIVRHVIEGMTRPTYRQHLRELFPGHFPENVKHWSD
jgi:hypothetical protein